MLEIVFSLFTLTLLEIVLGIDNLVFISVMSARLPPEKQKRARQFGLCLAWVTRLLLLTSALWLSRLTTPLLSIGDFAVSIRDIFLLCGGLFLIVKATQEIHLEMDSATEAKHIAKPKRFWPVIFQIGILDIIFSLGNVYETTLTSSINRH